MFKKLFIFLVSLFVFLSIAADSISASTLSLSPGGVNIPSGSTVSVQVRLNTGGESINGISAYLSYPQDRLEVAWISYGGSFSIAAEGSYGGGSIRISRGSISGASGNLNIATIGLRGKSQGVATVSFVGGSAAARTSDSSDSLNLGGSSGGVFTVGLPKPGVTTPPLVTGTTQQPQDTTKPVISNIKVSEISTNSALITWDTDEKADSTVEYGLNEDRYFLETTNKDLTQTHSIKLEGPALMPGILLHFRVKSKDKANNETISEDSTIRLKGYNIKVRIVDEKNKPIQNMSVVFYSYGIRSNTDVNGEVYFLNVTSGKHLIVIKLKNGLEKTREIDVAESDTIQQFTLAVVSSYKDNLLVLTPYIFLLVIVVGVAVGMVVIFKKKRSLV